MLYADMSMESQQTQATQWTVAETRNNQVVNELFKTWEQRFIEGRTQLNKAIQTQKDAIRELAKALAEQPTMVKSVIARLIVQRFEEDKIPIKTRYVYRTLPSEYKDADLSEASRNMNKQRMEDGYDARVRRIVDPKNYNFDMLKGDQYAYRTVRNIAIHLHSEVARLSGMDAIKENEVLKRENESFRKEVEGLRAENSTLKNLFELKQHA